MTYDNTHTFDHSAAQVDFDSNAKFLRTPHQELAEKQNFGDVYVLVRKLGQGGMGQCWQADEYADDKRQGQCRPVVIKIVPPDVQIADDEMERVKDVFYATEKLNHPNICPVYALKRDKDFGHYLVMRYIDGKPLNKYRHELCQKGNITLEDTLKVFKPLAEALDYAHKQKVIHRDIKPSNVMIENGVPYLIDFGLAAQIQTSVTKVSKAITSQSGTLAYMSPEQWKGESQREQTDQYALGVMLYEFLGGDPPFLSSHPDVMRHLVTQEKMPPLEGVPASVNFALAKALAKERKERWNSCVEFIKALSKQKSVFPFVSIGIFALLLFSVLLFFMFLGGEKENVVSPDTPQQTQSTPQPEPPVEIASESPLEEPVVDEKVDELQVNTEEPAVPPQSEPLPESVPEPSLDVSTADQTIKELQASAAKSQEEYDALLARQAEESKRRKEAEDTLQKIIAETQSNAEEVKKKTDELNTQIEADRKAAAEAESQIQAKKAEADRQKKVLEDLEMRTAALKTQQPLLAAIQAGQKAGELFEFELSGVKWRFRWCPAGSFMMGSPSSEKGRDTDETQHQVTLTQGFWLGETEVTQEQWATVMDSNPSHFKGGKLPVEHVSWDGCQDFVRKLNELLSTSGESKGYRFSLPTEAQWEYACRAGSTTAYSFGDDVGSLSDYAWYGKNSDNTTQPVGTKKPNGWGLYDMHGNVWEWCQDWYGDYPNGTVVDPSGASSGSRRVYRGGSWYSVAQFCRSVHRGNRSPVFRDYYLGLRLSLVPGKEPLSEPQTESVPELTLNVRVVNEAIKVQQANAEGNAIDQEIARQKRDAEIAHAKAKTLAEHKDYASKVAAEFAIGEKLLNEGKFELASETFSKVETIVEDEKKLIAEIDRLKGEIETKMKLRNSIIQDGTIIVLAYSSRNGWKPYAGGERIPVPKKEYLQGVQGYIFVPLSSEMVGEYRRGIEHEAKGDRPNAKQCLEKTLNTFMAALQEELKS